MNLTLKISPGITILNGLIMIKLPMRVYGDAAAREII